MDPNIKSSFRDGLTTEKANWDFRSFPAFSADTFKPMMWRLRRLRCLRRLRRLRRLQCCDESLVTSPSLRRCDVSNVVTLRHHQRRKNLIFGLFGLIDFSNVWVLLLAFLSFMQNFPNDGCEHFRASNFFRVNKRTDATMLLQELERSLARRTRAECKLTVNKTTAKNYPSQTFRKLHEPDSKNEFRVHSSSCGSVTTGKRHFILRHPGLQIFHFL